MRFQIKEFLTMGRFQLLEKSLIFCLTNANHFNGVNMNDLLFSQIKIVLIFARKLMETKKVKGSRLMLETSAMITNKK